MLFTKKSEYALLALLDIAKDDKPISVDRLSLELKIPKSFLAKIMQNLSKSNIVVSYKGVNGGFALNKKLKEITIFEIILSVEEKKPHVFECSSDNNICFSNIGSTCSIWPVLNSLQNKIDNFLQVLTLADLFEQH